MSLARTTPLASLLVAIAMMMSRAANAQPAPPNEPPKDEPAKPDTAKDEAAKPEPPKDEPPKDEPPKDAAPKGEPKPVVDSEPAPSAWAPPPTLEPAPLADEANGIAVQEPATTKERLRWIPRVIFFVPRWAFWLLAQPIRFGAWTYEVTRDKFKGALFSIDQSYGIYPVASYSTDFGFSVGVRVVHYNLFGQKERLKLFADWGGEFRQGYGLTLTSGQRVAKRFRASIDARFQRRPGDRFFGIGNSTELDAPPDMPIDPQTDDAAIASRYREDAYRVTANLDTRIVDALSFRVTGAWAQRSFGVSTFATEQIADNYDTSRLIGFDSGVHNLYAEAELLYDSRRPTSKYISQAQDATGWFVSAYAGKAKGIRDDTTDFTRYGGEVQKFLDLYGGSRVLTLRAMVDGVTGTDGRSDGKISFIDLPRLGGPDFLRGYPRDRFRDRIVALATAEYDWDLGNYLGGYLFADMGKPMASIDQIVDRPMRIGFGGGLEFRTYTSFLIRGQLAASRDGDLFLELALSPAFGRRERAGRL